MSAWAIELYAICTVAEVERAWFATHFAAGHLSAIPDENIQRHLENLAKIRDLAEAIAEHLGDEPARLLS